MESTRNLLLPQVSLEAQIGIVLGVALSYYGPYGLNKPLLLDDQIDWTRFIIVLPPRSPPLGGLRAIKNSIKAQHPYIEPPRLAELFEMWRSQKEKREETGEDWMPNLSLLASVLYTWGEAHGQYLNLGVVMDHWAPFWCDYPFPSVIVWVHLDESNYLFSGLNRIMDPLPGSSLSANVTAAISQPSQSSQGDYVLPQDIGAFQGQLLGTNGNNPRGVSSDETRGPVSQSVDVPMQNRVSPPIYTPGETTGETPEADPITLFLQQHPRTNTVHAYDRNESGIVTIHSLPETLHRANVYESSNVSGSFLRKTYTTLFFHLNEAEHGQLLARARASDIAISAQLPDRGLLWWPTADIDFNDDPHLPWSSVTAALINAGLLDTQAMQRVLDENRERLILGGHHGRPYDALFVDAQRRFASALLRRCCYIVAFEQHFLHYPYNQTISDSDFYFLLGPDPDTDDFVLRHGLLRAYAPPRPGEVSKPDPMINMYGFKHRDLLCIRYNSNVAETQSNWETIFRYHILQSWLGPSHCTNIRETLTCAFYHLSDLRKQAQPEDETQARQLLDFFPFASSTAAPLRSAALFRLEMDVAARLVERLWEDPRTPGSGRSRPMLRREQFSAVGSPRPGQWDDLPPGLQWTLLGWPRRTDLAEKYARFLKMPIPARTGTGEGQEQEQEE